MCALGPFFKIDKERIIRQLPGRYATLRKKAVSSFLRPPSVSLLPTIILVYIFYLVDKYRDQGI